MSTIPNEPNNKIEPCPPTTGNNHDAESDDHNMIFAAFAILLTLLTVFLAFVQCRRDRQRSNVEVGVRGNQNGRHVAEDLAELGE